jgi:L-malate glycosyltransferase
MESTELHPIIGSRFAEAAHPARERAAAKGVLLVGNFSPTSNRVSVDLGERLARSGWPVLTTSHRAGRAARVLDMLHCAWTRRHNYDLAQVDVYSWDAFLWAEAVCWLLRRAGKPYVLTLHGGSLPRFAGRWPGRVRRLLGSAAAVTAPSPYLLEHLRPYRPDLCLLPNARDLEAYAARLRRNPRPRLVWLRRFCDFYNPMLAPRVVARLAPEFPEIHLTMVGPDGGDGSLQATRSAAAAARVAGRIAFVGGVPQAEVPGWLGRGDIFLNTTNVDNTPLSILEAMACGLCIVSTDVGGLPYLLTHEENALLVPPDDPEATAAAVRRLLVEPGLAERLSRNARAHAERFDWPVVLPQWESLLRAVLETRR